MSPSSKDDSPYQMVLNVVNSDIHNVYDLFSLNLDLNNEDLKCVRVVQCNNRGRNMRVLEESPEGVQSLNFSWPDLLNTTAQRSFYIKFYFDYTGTTTGVQQEFDPEFSISAKSSGCEGGGQ